MAQGVAWMARELGVPATIIAPHNSSPGKLAAVERLGGRVVHVTWDEWWAAMEAGGLRRRRRVLRPSGARRARDGGERDDRARARGGSRRVRLRRHPVGRRRADDRDRERAPGAPTRRPGSSSASPRPVRRSRRRSRTTAFRWLSSTPPSFIDGAGSGALLPDMWERANALVVGRRLGLAEGRGVSGSRAGRARAHRRRGRGRARVATALAGQAGTGRVVCIVCGGNIDPARLAAILDGRVPD